MSAGIKKMSEIQRFENILADAEATKRDLAVALEKVQEKEEELARLKEDGKDLEQFRPILEQPLIDFYNIKLSGSPLMKMLLARMTKLVGPRFQLSGEDGQERRFARQRMSEVVTNCVRYCVLQNSRWNDMVAHYMSETE